MSPGEAEDVIEEEARRASLLGSPHLGHDTHGSTTKQGIGEQPGESYGKTSFLPVLCRISKSHASAQGGNLWQSVHTDDDQAVNLNVFHGGDPLSFVCAQFRCCAQVVCPLLFVCLSQIARVL